MLSVGLVKGAAQAATYFDKDNYYMGGSEGPSLWWGAGAEAAGLAGPVDRRQFEAALNGQLPDGTRLGTEREGKHAHKPGWDLTWSAPKSVSLMALVAGDTRLIAAHEAAVRAAMAHVQATLAYTRVRTGGEVTLVRTDTLAAALFHHDLNRDQEPQLHTHAVVLNATRTGDGTWRSLETRPLFRAIKETGAVYRSHLAAEVRRLGYDISPGKDATFEIAGVGQDILDRFSSRSAAIETELSRRDLTRATATSGEKMTAALVTRRDKEPADAAALQQAWRDRLGDALPALDALKRNSGFATRTTRKFAATQLTEARQAVLAAVAALSEREQVFSHDRLEQSALRFAIGRANPDAIQRTIGRLVTERVLVPRTATEPDREGGRDTERPGYTTHEAIRSEARLFALLDRARNAARPIAPLPVARAAVDAADAHGSRKAQPWNQGQLAAAIGILRSRDAIVLLQGWAGTAKTSTVLATVTATARAAGYTVHALAPTASAARTLHTALDVPATTVHRFLGDRDRDAGATKTIGERLTTLVSGPRELWIVDEMSLLGTRKTVELLEAARRHGAQVLLTGDRLQLGSVEAGRAFAQAQDRNIDLFRLDEIVRQKTGPGREAVRSAIDRNAGAVLRYLEQDQGRIIEHADPADRITMMAQHYASLPPEQRGRTLLIDPSREGSEAIKGAVRTLLRMQGELTGPTAHGTRLLDAGLANAEKKFAASYTAGDVVRAGETIQGLNGTLPRNEYAVIAGVDAARGQLAVRRHDGETVTLVTADLKPARLDVFREKPGELQAGDRIRWNRNDRPLNLARGDFGTVTDIEGNLATIAFDTGTRHTLDISQRQHQHYDYGYASTAYGAQGQTKNWVFHAESWRINLINWRSFYVGISRGEVSGTIITDSRQGLIDAVAERAGEKSAAIDNRDLAGLIRDAATAAMTAEARDQLRVHVPAGPAHDLNRASAQARLATIRSHSKDRAAPAPTSPRRQQEPGLSPDP